MLHVLAGLCYGATVTKPGENIAPGQSEETKGEHLVSDAAISIIFTLPQGILTTAL